ncbi:IS3 family transposase [Maribacter aquimaris]|uniref:IS3 family transposase n=1 Tax=Maribacter aquimaris TaxID=2737171 RepID=UPI00293B9908|nr:IS3 family transposase [Maribacter aquimaris]
MARVIDIFREEHQESLTSTCGLLGRSRQVYYRHLKSQRRYQTKAAIVIEMVQRIRSEQPRIGTRKLHYLLKDDLKGIQVGRDRLFAILRANRMLIKPKRSYHITTDSHHRFRKHRNLMKKMDVKRPEQVWVSDITYVGNRNNPMYLALVTDAYSKKIVGYDVSDSLDVSSSCKALKMAGKSRKTYKVLLHHSDRGLQYCSGEYQRLLSKDDINCSMTEAYDPYENAVAERINGILKQEFLGDTKNLRLKTMKQLVSDSIQIYNNKRPHYSNYYLTPQQMHQQQKIQMRTYKSKKLNEDILVELN